MFDFSSLFEYLWKFTSGIIAAFVVKILIDLYYEFMEKRKYRIIGTWGEVLTDEVERRYSLGEILFDRKKGIYCYNGTNYGDDGIGITDWVTFSSYLDIENASIIYMFRAKYCKEDGRYHGFGVIDLQKQDGKLVPTQGTFVSVNIEKTLRHHLMVNLDGLFKYKRGVKVKEFVEFMKKNYP